MLNEDIQSSQFISAHPEHDLEISDPEFSDMVTSYLGVESTNLRHYASESIPCSRAQHDGDVTCDPYGFALASATLPITTFTECHDNIDRALCDILEEGFQVHREPRHLFTHDIPPVVLAGTGQNRPGIIPDFSLYASMRPPSTARRQPLPRQVLPARLLHFDTKTVTAAPVTTPQAGQSQARARLRQSRDGHTVCLLTIVSTPAASTSTVMVAAPAYRTVWTALVESAGWPSATTRRCHGMDTSSSALQLMWSQPDGGGTSGHGRRQRRAVTSCSASAAAWPS